MAIEWRNEKDPRGYPEVSDDVISRVLARYSPVVATDNQSTKFSTIEVPSDVRNTSYSWSPTLVREVTFFKNVDQWMSFEVGGYYGFFRPTIYGVISQMPDRYVTDGFYERMDAWWIDPDSVQIFRSGLWQRAHVWFGMIDFENGG